MCLARIFEVTDENENMICEDISRVSVSGNEITMIDLFGSVRSIKGTILDIDLLGNKIRIQPETAA